MTRCQEVYQYNVAISTVPGMILRPLLGWKTVDSFSADEQERERPVADVYAS
jgi:hypothetical protein